MQPGVPCQPLLEAGYAQPSSHHMHLCIAAPVRLVTMSAGSTQQHWPFPSGSAEETGYAYILTHPGIPCIMWEHYFDHGFGGCIKHLVEVR